MHWWEKMRVYGTKMGFRHAWEAICLCQGAHVRGRCRDNFRESWDEMWSRWSCLQLPLNSEFVVESQRLTWVHRLRTTPIRWYWETYCTNRRWSIPCDRANHCFEHPDQASNIRHPIIPGHFVTYIAPPATTPGCYFSREASGFEGQLDAVSVPHQPLAWCVCGLFPSPKAMNRWSFDSGRTS